MTPERWAEIKKISTGLGSHGLLVGIIHELIAEVERLRASLDQANKRIVELLGKNRALKAELHGLQDRTDVE